MTAQGSVFKTSALGEKDEEPKHVKSANAVMSNRKLEMAAAQKMAEQNCPIHKFMLSRGICFTTDTQIMCSNTFAGQPLAKKQGMKGYAQSLSLARLALL